MTAAGTTRVGLAGTYLSGTFLGRNARYGSLILACLACVAMFFWSEAGTEGQKSFFATDYADFGSRKTGSITDF